MLEISGHDLTQFQRCERIHRIGLTHRVEKWRASSLMAACLRHAIFDLSKGKDLKVVSDRAVMFFLAAARNPGLDAVGIDTYTYAMDMTAIIRNILEYISRTTLMTMSEMPKIEIEEGVTWRFLSHVDGVGMLHQWKVVDYIPEDPIDDLHSWEIFGDVAAADAPMMLHYIAIGRRSGSHQASPWCRTYAHPTVANIYRFNKNSGDSLKGTWRPVYFSGSEKNTPERWIDWMENDGAIKPLVLDIHVRQVSQSYLSEFRHDVMTEARKMMQLSSDKNIRNIPKRRYSCDHPYICPHQLYCYSDSTLDSVGIYKRVGSKADQLVEV